MYVCVCPKIDIWRALSKKVTVTPRSQTNKNVFSAHLNRSVDKSAKRREDGTVPDPGSSDSETPTVQRRHHMSCDMQHIYCCPSCYHLHHQCHYLLTLSVDLSLSFLCRRWIISLEAVVRQQPFLMSEN